MTMTMTHKGKPEVVFIAITQPDGNVAVMQFITLVKRNEDDPGQVREATPENIVAEIAKAGFGAAPWRIIQPGGIPQDRTFRNAWKDDGSAIVHDMGKARAIHMDRIRASRNAALAATDIEVTRAMEAGEDMTELKKKRQALRDIPQTLDLTKAATVEDLKAIWPAELA